MHKFISYKDAVSYLVEQGVWDTIKYNNLSTTEVVDLATKTNAKVNRNKILLETMSQADKKAKSTVTITGITVSSEFDKQQLLAAFEYIQGLKDVDTSYNALKAIASVYENPNLIEIEEN